MAGQHHQHFRFENSQTVESYIDTEFMLLVGDKRVHPSSYALFCSDCFEVRAAFG